VRFGRTLPERVVTDFVIVAAAGGVVGAVLLGEGFGFSVAAACLWLALNFSALAWLLAAATSPKRASRLFLFTLACAKIPASYFILYWLYRMEYLEPVGLTIGLSSLPVVILFRGLRWRPEKKAGEEG
jgi:hypothetical protein